MFAVKAPVAVLVAVPELLKLTAKVPLFTTVPALLTLTRTAR